MLNLINTSFVGKLWIMIKHYYPIAIVTIIVLVMANITISNNRYKVQFTTIETVAIAEVIKEPISISTTSNIDVRYINRSDNNKLSEKQNIVYKICRDIGVADNAQIASILGQIKIETSNFDAVEEAYYLANPWPYRARYGGYHGRGLIQLTWRSNYERWSKWLGVDLINNPNMLITDYNLSAKVACSGVKHGSFTGSGNLDQYINTNKIDYYNSRSIVNGDKNYYRNGRLVGDLLTEYSQEFYNLITQ
jgi:hypothetical protein